MEQKHLPILAWMQTRDLWMKRRVQHHCDISRLSPLCTRKIGCQHGSRQVRDKETESWPHKNLCGYGCQRLALNVSISSYTPIHTLLATFVKPSIGLGLSTTQKFSNPARPNFSHFSDRVQCRPKIIVFKMLTTILEPPQSP